MIDKEYLLVPDLTTSQESTYVHHTDCDCSPDCDCDCDCDCECPPLLSSKMNQSDCDCDCDCCDGDCGMAVQYHQSRVSFVSFQGLESGNQLYHISPTLLLQNLVDDYYIAADPSNNQPVILLNSNVRNVLNKFQTPYPIYPAEKLEISLINRLVQMGLLLPVSQQSKLLPGSKQILVAWLHITDRCNLRCSYCYLPHVREDMSDETGRATIDAIFRSALSNGFKQIKIKYAGGEPLLRFPFIVELHKYAQSLAKQNNMVLDGVVLSNGTLLTVEIIESIKSLSLRLMISLDGLGESHDRHRPYAGGHGSFADVSSAVRLALDNGLIPNISVTVSGRTAEDLPKLISWILKHDLPFSLNFYRENELSASNTDMRLDEEKIINGMLAAFKVIESNLPRRSLLPALVDRANLSAPHLHTCGVGQNYLVFDQNGQVAKCQMHIRKPITNIHVKDPLAVIRADQIGIQNLSVEEKEGCRTCEWKYWCTGGCSLATHRATGRYDVKSPNCNIYKALYPEAVRLEGLR